MTDNTASKCPFGFGAGSSAPSPDATDGAAPAYGTHAAMAAGLSRDKLPELLREPVQPGADGLPTGRCLCGKISYQIKRPISMVFANHDAASRRRSGGMSLTVMIGATNTAFSGWGHLVHYMISERETSCFCRVCGTPVFLRYAQPAAMDGMISISAGTLDSTEGLRLAADISDDERPAYYAFANERRAISAAELEAMFSRPRG